MSVSDDSLLLAPSIFALHKMINICEDFALSHNLKFKTDPDPIKCNTTCTAFTRKVENDDLPAIKNCVEIHYRGLTNSNILVIP